MNRSTCHDFHKNVESLPRHVRYRLGWNAWSGAAASRNTSFTHFRLHARPCWFLTPFNFILCDSVVDYLMVIYANPVLFTLMDIVHNLGIDFYFIIIKINITNGDAET